MLTECDTFAHGSKTVSTIQQAELYSTVVPSSCIASLCHMEVDQACIQCHINYRYFPTFALFHTQRLGVCRKELFYYSGILRTIIPEYDIVTIISYSRVLVGQLPKKGTPR